MQLLLEFGGVHVVRQVHQVVVEQVVLVRVQLRQERMRKKIITVSALRRVFDEAFIVYEVEKVLREPALAILYFWSRTILGCVHDTIQGHALVRVLSNR